MKIFEQFNQVGVSVMIASHDLNLIDEMGYPVISLDDGQLVRNDLALGVAS